MNAARTLLLLLALAAAWPAAEAREFRSIQPIARPGALPAGAQAMAEPLPVPRSEVEQAVHAVARAWNTGEMDPLLSDDFASKSRLLDTLAEVVPRDARLAVLGIGAVSTLEQYRQEGRAVSTVSAVVHSQIEFNDPLAGFVRLPGRAEWYFRVEEGETEGGLMAMRESLQRLAEDEHRDRVAGLNERLERLEAPLPTVALAPSMSAIQAATAEDLMTATVPPEPDADRPYVERVLPPSPRWDDTVTILGRGFGPTRGIVYVGLRDSRVTLPFRVLTWTESDVTAVIHEASMRELPYVSGFGPEPMAGVIWVDRAMHFGARGDPRLRAGQEITFQPTPALLTPAITAVQSGAATPSDPPTVTPGQTLRLLGSNFLDRPGSAAFHIGGRTIPAEVSGWTCGSYLLNCSAEVTLPASVEGLVGQGGTVTVTNRLGWTGEHPVTFVPRKESTVLEDSVTVDCVDRTRVVWQWFFDYPLSNGWAVYRYSIDPICEELRPSLRMICHQRRPPVMGSNNPRTELGCGCYGGGLSRCVVRVPIEGPAGTYHYGR